MSWVCEVAVTGSPDRTAPLAAWLSGVARPLLTALPSLDRLDAYVPAGEESRDPYNRKEEAPLLLLVAAFASEAGLRAAFAAPALREALEALPEGVEATVSALSRTFYAPSQDGRLDAPVSYVVRYTRPAADEALFVRNYVDSHPSTQAHLPGIRAVMCYFPLRDLALAGWPARDYLIGNEVAFDSVEAFNAAMLSPAREELRAHFREFPAYSGINSHFLMRRRRLGANAGEA